MTKLVSMKMSKKEAKETMVGPATSSDAPKYPYGLELRLGNDELEKLGLTEGLKAGTKCTITAEAQVTEYREVERMSGDDSCSMEIQITALAIEPTKKSKKDAKAGMHLNKIAGSGEGDDY